MNDATHCPDCGKPFEIREDGRPRRKSIYQVNKNRIPVSRYVCEGCAARWAASFKKVTPAPNGTAGRTAQALKPPVEPAAAGRTSAVADLPLFALEGVTG